MPSLASKALKFNTMEHEYKEDESVDSFDSDFKYTDVGDITIDPKQLAGDYLPALRHGQELTIVPEEPIMKKAAAPNQRLESIAGHLEADRLAEDATDEEKMYELLYLLGLSKPDEDGHAIFKKHKLVPDKTLYSYILGAFRLRSFLELSQGE